MKRFAAYLVLIFCISNSFAQSEFITDQKRYSRVRESIKEKQEIIETNLNKHEIKLDNLNILIIAYKAESKLELFAKNKTDSKYQKINTYSICSKSGHLGPKRKQGDYQVPEGFYEIDRFNPVSTFYLSLGINYPNTSDHLSSNAKNLGGDIFIHGSCVTIGCLPMTDDKIKEIFLYAINAKNNGQRKIPVYIFPFEMTKQKFELYNEIYKSNKELIDFWTNIKTGYDMFQKNI